MIQDTPIHQLDMKCIIDTIELDYADGDIAIIDDLKDLPDIDAIKLDMIIVLLCVSGKLQLDINSVQYSVYEKDIIIAKPNVIINNCMISPDFSGKIVCVSNKIINSFRSEERRVGKEC